MVNLPDITPLKKIDSPPQSCYQMLIPPQLEGGINLENKSRPVVLSKGKIHFLQALNPVRDLNLLLM